MGRNVFFGGTVLKELEKEIEHLREKLMTSAMELGMDHPDVIALSRCLDELLLEWHRQNGDVVMDPLAERVYRIKPLHSGVCETAFSVLPV